MSSDPQLSLLPLPRMPFSSPIDEELISPSMSTFSNPRAAPATPSGGREMEVKGHSNHCDRKSPRIHNMKDQSMNARWPAEQRKDSFRPRPPELNLVTNFTRPTGPSYNPAYKTNVEVTSQQNRQAKGSAPSSYRKEASDQQEWHHDQSLQFKRSLSRKRKTPDGMKGPIDSLKRASGKITELSPSDRTLVIGISIPSSKLAEHVSSPESASAELRSLSRRQYAKEHCSPVTPDITITPAVVDVPRLTIPNANNPWSRRRAASSVYSQATHYARGVSVMPEKSSVPPLPLSATRYGETKELNEKFEDDAKSRVTSWGTDFEEDEDPHVPFRTRPASGESQLRMLNRSSVDTVATRHRSQGWWNQILSPFLTRSSTLKSRTSPTYDEPHPALPITTDRQVPRILEPKSFVPRLSRSSSESEADRRRSGHTSIWTDLSRWDAERRTLVIAHPEPTNRNQDELTQSQHSPSKASPKLGYMSGLGTAAEYYEACWHDEHSPTPFFKCENHECPSVDALVRILQNSDDRKGLVESPEELSPYAAKGLTQKGTLHQTPSNHYSGVPREARVLDVRPKSDVTEIEDVFATPDGTPAVHEASAASVVRAGPPIATIRQPSPSENENASKDDLNTGPRSTPASSQLLPPYSPPREERPVRRYRAVLPPDNPRSAPGLPTSIEAVASQSTNPGIHQTMPEDDEIPLVNIPRDDGQRRIQNTYHIHQYYGGIPNEQPGLASSSTNYLPQSQSQPRLTGRSLERIEKSEKYYRINQNPKQSKWSRLDDCFGRVRPRNKKKRRCLYCWIISGLVSMIILTLVLAMTLTRRKPDIPVQSSWLNITGFPPIPTGISTVAQPDAVDESSSCVAPQTMWSCALPKEQQPSIAPNSPDQPNFRIEIRFNNSTTTSITNSSQVAKRSKFTSRNTMSAKEIIRSGIVHVRDSFTDSFFTPNPAPPSQEDQKFLGNTTDKNAQPFDGETTPFYISFLSTTPFSTKLRKRQQQGAANTTNPFPNLDNLIPPPDLNPNGTAAAANLLPFPSSQPLRLFDRGLPTEHYGFYNYFDRSIFLRSTALIDVNSTSVGEVPDDENGGAEEDAATVRCTWAQTRFLVQIWTNKNTTTTLLPSSNNTSQLPTPTATQNPSQPTHPANVTTSSANDFSRPGSFPYPISITLDRHGGDINTKLIYCYGIDDREHIVVPEKKIQLEDRGVGGTLVNPALGPFGHVNISTSEGGPGGIDGGDGGCQCQWRNWEGGSGG
ncbi:hypothetical protein MMC14_007594 [Varicellaria rhodocarpa]|nr:hypothetical protein [Varicellaria rhodocarpa]